MLTRNVEFVENTPYALVLGKSALSRVAKVNVASTVAENSDEERIEDAIMKTSETLIKNSQASALTPPFSKALAT
jgi:hypothetical protein